MSLHEFGPYNTLYSTTTSLWNGHVGVLVEKFLTTYKVPKNCKALDLGSGEGDNAIYLAKHGITVDLIELSPAAVKNYLNRTADLPREVNNRLHLYQRSVLDCSQLSEFDLVLAYGIFHCFSSSKDSLELLDHTIASLKLGGTLIVCFITSSIPINPKAHPDLAECFLPPKNFMHKAGNKLLEKYVEIEVIEERHGETEELHQHEIFRGIYTRV